MAFTQTQEDVIIEDLEKRIGRLTRALDVAEEKIQLACDMQRQKDLSQLASNPPRNGAVYDIQVILKEALEQIKRIKNA